MADSTSLQPFVCSCSVGIDSEAVERAINRFGYAELRGEMLKADIETCVEGARARAMLEFRDGYPLMQLLEVVDV